MTSQADNIVIRRTTGADWKELRDLRLEMLADTPHAFGETRESAGRHGPDEWRMRAARGEATEGILVVAIDGNGRWVGTMGGFTANGPDVTGPLLVGVYVTPTYRGASSGVAVALLDEVEKWAATAGESLLLHVHEDNARAIAFYERSGYRLTGVAVPYSLDPGQRELEMLKHL